MTNKTRQKILDFLLGNGYDFSGNEKLTDIVVRNLYQKAEDLGVPQTKESYSNIIFDYEDEIIP